MKTIKIIYWSSTIIIVLMMIFSAYSYLTNSQIKQAFIHLGFPSYFRVELALAKIAGAIILLIPVKTVIKEWAYAGFAIVFVSAFIAHLSSGDAINIAVMPAVFLLVLIASYLSYSKISFGYHRGASTTVLSH